MSDYDQDDKFQQLDFKSALINALLTKADELNITKIPASNNKKIYYVNASNKTLCYDIDGKPTTIQNLLQKKIKIVSTISTYDYEVKNKDKNIKDSNLRCIGITIKAKKIYETM